MTAADIPPFNSLSGHWTFASCAPGTVGLGALDTLEWLPARVPGTVAENLRLQGRWDPGQPGDLDAREYWFRCAFEAGPADSQLEFSGLATLAEVWLNGELILESDNMFLAYQVDVAGHLRHSDTNDLVIRFSSLTQALVQKKPRARWRTRLVSERNLRFYRTSLLGRTPGICPPVAPVGPWKGIHLRSSEPPRLLASTVHVRTAGTRGEIDLSITAAAGAMPPAAAWAELDGTREALTLEGGGDVVRLTGQLRINEVERWWPHTHGAQRRYALCIVLVQPDGREDRIKLAPVGFRTVNLIGGIDDFGLLINDRSIHCRGGCWMPLDVTTLNATREALRAELTLLRDAGMNMVRLSGITVYECDDFYDLCDELGILVWQDFMFASLDYPADNADFLHSAEQEARQLLQRIGHRPCLTVTCGGSEILQQVTMLGLPAALAESPWFDNMLPEICRALRPDTVHCRHSPVGGTLPFHGDKGVSHWFGVGGYRLPVDFAALEPPRFATECLAFSIPPDLTLIDAGFRSSAGKIDLGQYDASIPRDKGTDWHFGEVTDHYLKEVFAAEPAQLRASDPALYLQAAGIAVGEVMGRVAGEWRRNGFTRGVLIWTLRDLQPGGGWGIIDSNGHPKAPYWFLKRTWQPVAVYFRDRGTNGLWVGVHNDLPNALYGTLRLRLCRTDGKPVQEASITVDIEAASSMEWSVDALAGGFLDSSYAYRFGPPAFDVAAARVEFEGHAEEMIAHHVLAHVPTPLESPVVDSGLTADIVEVDGACIRLSVRTSSFVPYLILHCPGLPLSDNYFSLLPGEEKVVTLSGWAGNPSIGTLSALNGVTPIVLEASR